MNTNHVCIILAFIKSDRPNKYPNLTIRYVRGLDPIIKLMDSNGNVQEVTIYYIYILKIIMLKSLLHVTYFNRSYKLVLWFIKKSEM